MFNNERNPYKTKKGCRINRQPLQSTETTDHAAAGFSGSVFLTS